MILGILYIPGKSGWGGGGLERMKETGLLIVFLMGFGLT